MGALSSNEAYAELLGNKIANGVTAGHKVIARSVPEFVISINV